MDYTTIMVTLALNKSNDSCLAVARDLAEQFNARIIGIAAAEFSPPLYFTSGEAAQKLIDEGDATIKARLSEVERQFRSAVGQNADKIEWRCSRELPVRYIAQQARAADIIIIGQNRGDWLSDPFSQADPGELIMQAGRPMFVIPDSVRRLDSRNCLVAWKDSPEARRAIVGALPMLQKARQVTVAEVVEDGSDRSAALTRVRDVVGWLAGHGVTASSLIPDEGGDAATQLERVASNVGVGFIVAGAYGHSRLREWVLGGVTRRLLGLDRCSLLSR